MRNLTGKGVRERIVESTSLLAKQSFLIKAGVTQLVECNLAKVDVAGSNPVSRSKFPSSNISFIQSRSRIAVDPKNRAGAEQVAFAVSSALFKV